MGLKLEQPPGELTRRRYYHDIPYAGIDGL